MVLELYDDSLVGHQFPLCLVERSDFYAVTSDHAASVVSRTGPGHVRTGLGHRNNGSTGRRVRGSCRNATQKCYSQVKLSGRRAYTQARQK